MTSSTITVAPTTARRARPSDRAGIAAAMAAAFQDDPVFSWCTPDDRRRRAILPGFFDLALGIFAKHDETWCTGGDPAGGAIWAPAGVEPMTEADGERLGAWCVEAAGPDADRWFQIVALLDENHPHHTDHDYLWLLGVTPGQQGRGHGAAMLRAVLDRADVDGTPAYLEATSPRNRGLYERHGFAVTRELAVPGGPSLWAMWREPRS
ncbi:MAG: GNAT family N-acetyltransferase [Pseudonocardia sp.]